MKLYIYVVKTIYSDLDYKKGSQIIDEIDHTFETCDFKNTADFKKCMRQLAKNIGAGFEVIPGGISLNNIKSADGSGTYYALKLDPSRKNIFIDEN